MNEKLKLYGFNNLTKSLSFNIFDVCYAETQKEIKEYLEYIDEQYNSERLTKILCTVSDMIGAHVLSISRQDYDPQGASVSLLISEKSMLKNMAESDTEVYRFAKGNGDMLLHLDKSHVTVHTYPEYHPDNNVATFRVDIDVATCGKITPLSTLNFLIDSFDSDVITMDYRVRGFTRTLDGRKLFIDHDFTSIQDYIDPKTLDKYKAMDINIYQANMFHTKMMIKDIDVPNHVFKSNVNKLSEKQKDKIENQLKHEMIEIFSSRNIF